MSTRKALAAMLFAAALLSQPVQASAAVAVPEQRQLQVIAGGNQAAVQGRLLPADIFGAIIRYSVQISAGSGCIYMNASTVSNTIMKKIGLKNITVQYSTNGVSWTDAIVYGGILNSSTNYFSIAGRYYPAIYGSGYYRVKVTHYAYTTINAAQSVVEISNTVRVY